MRARQELAREGFEIQCEIVVQATLAQKLGLQREPYVFLSAYDPPLAHRALEAEPELGVRRSTRSRCSLSSANAALAPTATEARRRLTAVVERAAGESPQPDHDHQQQA